VDPDSSRDPDLGDLESMTSLVASRVGGDRLAGPLALTFLLRRYARSGASDADDNDENAQLGDTLGAALAFALGGHRDATTTEQRAEWLILFADASVVSGDDRLQAAARELVHELRRSWPDLRYVDEAAMSLVACLHAADIVEPLPDPLVPAVIDELERIVGAAYRPGLGMSHTIERSGLPLSDGCWPGDQIHTASALLSAYDKCGRLPYAMLADELMQPVRKQIQGRRLADAAPSDFPGNVPSDVLILDCAAVQVLCRLAAHYEDSGYLHDAVTLTDVNYRCEASHLLQSHSAQVLRECQGPHDALELERVAAYGLALLALTPV
jgi:hypothetical protein